MTLKSILLLGAFLAIGAAAVPLLGYSTNCGGNSAARAAAGFYAQFARSAAGENPNHVFRVTEGTAAERLELARLPGASWLPHAHFLVSTAPAPADARERRVVIVCDTPYTNVPERWIGSAPPTHAAGFSDGSSGLISPAEFAGLDWSSFAKINDLLRVSDVRPQEFEAP